MAQGHLATRRRRSLSLAVITAASLLIGSAAPAAAQIEPGAGGATFVGCPAWLADGSGLIYCSGDAGSTEIFELDADGNVRQLTYLGGQAAAPDVSQDGSLVVFEATREGEPGPQVYVIKRDGQRGRTVMVGYSVVEIPGERAVKLTSEGTNFDPAFQPSGQRIDFTSDRLGVTGLWSMNVDGSDQRELHLAAITE
jgi:TolB protein